MLLPIPGFSHIKTLAEPSANAEDKNPAASTHGASQGVHPRIIHEAEYRIIFLLDILFHVRPIHHLSRARLSPIAEKLVRRSIHHAPLSPGRVRLQRIHLRPAIDGADFEVYGTCSTSHNSYGFVARFGPPENTNAMSPELSALDSWLIYTFRIL